ncbi:hypothetical protein MES4922_10266 [Mesorhizobium ventifaucium]|uniref:Uncharacterized protein n=1 Tax=Mesorhizobium ventifaucium TaxID=666020 RepID=A0ABM9DD30_9HYPH|nr:hypothetical protein MES4922_10266 [Mesorhizobium ventifaucium]
MTAEGCRLLAIARSTYFDGSENTADNTAIVQAIVRGVEYYGWSFFPFEHRQFRLIREAPRRTDHGKQYSNKKFTKYLRPQIADDVTFAVISEVWRCGVNRFSIR